MKKRFYSALFVGATLLYGMQAQAMYNSNPTPSEQILASMHKPMMEAPFITSGNVEKDFLSNMLAHHQGAIDSSKLLLQFSKDSTLRTIAQEIIDAQEKEIILFNQLLSSKGYTQTKLSKKEYDKFTKDAKRDMDKMMMIMMRTQASESVDKDYITAMIAHHQGAVDASKQILQYSKDKKVKDIAKDIIQAQEKEIEIFNTLLSKF